MNKKTFAALAVLAGVWFCASQAAAQDVGKEKAKELFAQAIESYNAGKYVSALKDFEDSYKLYPHWKIKFNIAMCLNELGDDEQAAGLLSEFIDEGKGDIPEKQGEQALKTLDELKAKLAALVFSGKLEEATVTIDGNVKEGVKEGKKVFVRPGKHHVSVQTGSGTLADTEIDLTGGTEKEIKVATVPVKKVEKTVPEVKEGGKGGEPEVGKKAGALKPAAYGTLAGGLAILVASCVTGGLVFSEKGKMQDVVDAAFAEQDLTPEERAAYEADRDKHYDKAKGLASATDALLVIGGALTVTSIILFAVDKKKGSGERKVGAAVGAGPGSVSLKLDF